MNEYITKCRDEKDTLAGKAFLVLLEKAVEDWKDKNVGLPYEEVLRYHGAIEHVNRLLIQIKNPPPEKQRDGGYNP